MTAFSGYEIAVLLPCFNEELSIARVVDEFRDAMPSATIYVYDNNSTDETVREATRAGAIVRREPRQGKGNVVRRMFADIEADVYVMADGDATYDAVSARDLVAHLIENRCDLVNGARMSESEREKTYRPGHRFGNWLISSSVGFVFSRGVDDMLSGMKVLSRRFVKSFPALSGGFEIETEITIHALELSMPLDEIATPYRERVAGSASKLNTVSDGLRISRLIFKLVRVEKPMLFFGTIFLILAAIATALGLSLFLEFRATGLVPRLPTGVFATGLMLVAFLSAVCGLILENVTLGRKEAKRMTYLAIPAVGLETERKGKPFLSA